MSLSFFSCADQRLTYPLLLDNHTLNIGVFIMHLYNDSEQQDRILIIIDGIGSQCSVYDALKESRDMPMVCFSCEHYEDCCENIAIGLEKKLPF